jgi:integrase/recombinase XerD
MAENDTIQRGEDSANIQNSANVNSLPETPLSAPLAVTGTSEQVATSLTATPVNSLPPTPPPGQSRKKPTRHYEQFGEVIRYLTLDEWQQLLDAIDNYRHKLMLRLIYHLGCRVGEFVRIQLKHLDFGRSSVFIPAENTKTGFRRTSHVPVGLMNEIKSMLKREDRMLKRTDAMRNPDEYLFRHGTRLGRRYSENRVRQVFQKYVRKAGLDREYGVDSQGRKLHEFTVHSLRHSHITHAIQDYKLPLPIVQKQVGHRTLKATSVYLNPSDEAVGEAYEGIEHR